MTTVDVFQIQGRGTVITGWPGPHIDLARRGVPIKLDSPTHGIIGTAIAGIEMFLRGRLNPEPPHLVGILLADPIPSEQLPKGTKVYYAGSIIEG